MNILTAAITTVLIIFVLNFVFERYHKQRQLQQEDLKARLEVLKIVAKHECYGQYQNEPERFQAWVGVFLELRGYSGVKLEEGMTGINPNGQKTYIDCQLADPAAWDQDITKRDIQNMVGVMIGQDIHQGLIVTTGKLSPEAKDLITMIAERGYFISWIDGGSLEEELYALRVKKLPELQEAW